MRALLVAGFLAFAAMTSAVVADADETYLLYIPQVVVPSLALAPTKTPTSTSTTTATPTPTNTALATAIPTSTSTATSTQTPTSTPTPTETATSTATATSTSTPTTTPTVTPTPTVVAGDGITVLNNHSTYVNSLNYLHVMGEVRNDAGVNARFIRISVNLFDTPGQLIDTESGYASLDVLLSSDRTCFDVFFLSNPTWSYYEFETEYLETVNMQRPLVVFNDSLSYNSTFDWTRVIGQIRNDGSSIETYPRVVGTLYNLDGKVVDCDTAYSNADSLAPGQVSTWEMLFLNSPPNGVGTYRLQPD